MFGTVPQSNDTVKPPTAEYSLDAAAPFVTTAPTADTAISNQPLFAASSLSSQEHELVIRIKDAQAPYTLDHFFVFPKIGNTTQNVVNKSPTPTPRTSETPAPGGLSTVAQDPSAMTIRALAGILGSLVVIVLLVLAVFLFRRQRHSRSAMREEKIGVNSNLKYSVKSRGKSRIFECQPQY